MSDAIRDRLDFAAGRAASLLQRILTRRHEYPTCDWEDLVRDLGEMYGRDAERILAEPALSEVESHVRHYLRSIEGVDPFERRWASDSLFARCCYLACRLTGAKVVVETGVAYGVSSAFILTALRENGGGELHSLDLPPLRRDTKRFLGGAIPDRLRSDWSLTLGASHRFLPGILKRAGDLDLFVHDSLHTARNMRREFGLALTGLKPGGILLADDVERNGAFGELYRDDPALRRVVRDRETEPLHGVAAPVTFGVVAI